MNDAATQAPKQQIVEKIKTSSNILVTVSRNPSVDELTAALGMTIMLNDMNKHATAVVSGEIPPAITFLDPEKTFENTVDSLRDFIIALDKEKADHLRYKVEGDVVKIFITPYRTTLSQDDLDFSQGDYNVELVLALGVESKEDLDEALGAHGRILHDATVATIEAGDATSNLGTIDWSEPNASCISEMLVGLVESIKSDEAGLNEQIATAFLTGIVSATDRFSNNKTTSKAMTMAAQLMAAGANQQLIASRLEEANEIGPNKAPDDDEEDAGNSDGTTELDEGKSNKINKKNADKEAKEHDGSLSIAHEKQGDIDEVAEQTAKENQQDAADAAEEKLAEQLATVAPAAAAKPTVDDLQKDIAKANNVTEDRSEPSMGGTLNATTEQAAEDKRRAIEADKNRTILTHGGGALPPTEAPTMGTPEFNAATMPSEEGPKIDPFAVGPNATEAPTTPSPFVPQPPEQQPMVGAVPMESLADIDAKNRAHDDARAAAEAVFTDDAANLAPSPQVFEEPVATPPPIPPVVPPTFTPLPPPSVDFSAPLPPPPPPLDFGTLPSVPPVQPTQPLYGNQPVEAPAAPPPPADPGQFQIPGQN